MQTKLKVEGMSCTHCENTVKKTVSLIGGVTEVSVDLKKKLVTVTHNEKININTIKSEIEKQGYDVVI